MRFFLTYLDLLPSLWIYTTLFTYLNRDHEHNSPEDAIIKPPRVSL